MALALWFTVSGEERTETSLHMALEFVNLPAKMVLTGEVPAELQVRVIGPRSIVNKLSQSRLTQTIDLASYKGGPHTFYLGPNSFSFPRGVVVTRIQPNPLMLKLSPTISATLPVKPVLAGNPDLDEVHAYTKSKHRGDGQTLLGVYWQRLKLMVKLRLAGYDLAILASCSFVPSAFRLAQQVGPRRILSFVTGEQPGLERKVSDPVPYHPDPLEHETERAAKLLLPLGIQPPYPPARVFADPETRKRLNAGFLNERRYRRNNGLDH